MRLFASVFVAIFIAVRFSAFADSVVIASNAPGINPGYSLKTGAPLPIPENASVTLVFESGKTATLEGPRSGPIGTVDQGGGDGRLLTEIIGLLLGSGGTTESIGAMRQSGDTPSPPNPWVIDIHRSGDHCVPSRGPLRLWRAAKTGNIILKNLVDKSASMIDWPPESDTVPWPSEVTLKGSTQYLVRLTGSRKTTLLDVHLVPNHFPSDAHRAVWMADQGCVEQAKLLLAHLR